MPRVEASSESARSRPAEMSSPADDFQVLLDHVRRKGLDPSALVFVEGILRQNRDLLKKLEDVQQAQEQLRAQHDALTAPAHYPAVITGVMKNGKLTAEVFAGKAFLEVAVNPEIAHDRLKIGVKGRVTQARNCLLDVLDTPPAWSEIATFDGWSADGDLLIQYQGMLKKVRAVDGFDSENLRNGDQIGFDPEARLAYARVASRKGNELFLEETPSDRFDELGGLDREIARFKRFLDFRLKHAETARRYRLPTKAAEFCCMARPATARRSSPGRLPATSPRSRADPAGSWPSQAAAIIRCGWARASSASRRDSPPFARSRWRTTFRS